MTSRADDAVHKELPIVQIAIDLTSADDARVAIGRAITGGADWIEFGRPLIDHLGFHGLKDLAGELGDRYLVLDAMIMAAPERYLNAAKMLGVSNLTVSALAPEVTVATTIELGKAAGIEITVDLFNVVDPVAMAQKFEKLGADYVMVHFGIDQKKQNPGGSPIQLLQDVVSAVDIPVSYATYDIEESLAAVTAGAAVIVQGEPLGSGPEDDLHRFISRTKEFGSRRQAQRVGDPSTT